MAVLPMSMKDSNGYSGMSDNARLCLRFAAKRYLVFCFTGFVVFTLLLRSLYFHDPQATETIALEDPEEKPALEDPDEEPQERWPGARLPPLYSQYHEYELGLPQHHWHATPHEGEPKVFFMAGHNWGNGWGNVFQEIVMNAYVSYKSNRAFVFYNYTWSYDGDYADYNGKPIPSRIPLSALVRARIRTLISVSVAGPIVGGAFPPGLHSPPAIAEQYYREICTGRIKYLNRDEVHKNLPARNMDATSKRWVATLGALDDPCVEVTSDPGAPFDWVVFGDRNAIHEVWADLAASPVLTHFGWSSLVELAFDTNREVISPTSVYEPPLSASTYTANAERYTEIKGLLVLHVRRGDYEGHCEHLARWASSYLAFNAHRALEQFDPPPGTGGGEATPEGYAFYRQHCYPSIEQIVARVRDVRAGEHAQGLEHVYIMTNGPAPWVAELKAALADTLHFKHVASSRDLVLNWEQKYVAQATDMLVGQRAQVFIGNGWSSLTGGIVLMRMANRFHPETTRFF
ncbi:hypothetical protein C8Q80DRAFT_1120344 [Daedaleopsis nitida]|nr:hypothetical protein C8Q80DRAFT_1120344 [Daedaleopsis nitida]